MDWTSERPTVLAEGFHFLEGPRWRDGRLYVSDFYGHTVSTVTDDGTVTPVCSVEQQPSGLGFDPDGHLLVVSMLDKRLLRVVDGRTEVVAELGEYAAGPANDMIVDGAGRAYIGNFGSFDEDGGISATDLVRVDPDGSVSIAARDLMFPNGAVLSPDGTTLLIAETFASRISSFAVAEDGTLTDRQVWADFATPGSLVTTSISEPGTPLLPDGLSLDESGAVWVADAKGSGVLRIAPGGEVLEAIPTGDLSVFALTLGGDDRRTMYLCTAPALGIEDPSEHKHGVLMRCRVEVPGAGRP